MFDVVQAGTLAQYFPNAVFRRNVVIAGNGGVPGR